MGSPVSDNDGFVCKNINYGVREHAREGGSSSGPSGCAALRFLMRFRTAEKEVKSTQKVSHGGMGIEDTKLR